MHRSIRHALPGLALASVLLVLAACGGTTGGSPSNGDDDIAIESVATKVDDSTGNKMIIQQLESTGADMSEPREVIHYAYFSGRGAAEQAAATLEADGYTTSIDEVDGEVALKLTIKEVVTLDAITEETAHLQEVVGGAGGEYDGWEAAGTP